MKKSETKIQELKARLDMEAVPPEEFVQFVSEVINCAPEHWQNTARRAYLEGKGQLFDETTGKPLQTDSRFHIMNEHWRRGVVMLVTLAKDSPATLEWLLRTCKHG